MQNGRVNVVAYVIRCTPNPDEKGTESLDLHNLRQASLCVALLTPTKRGLKVPPLPGTVKTDAVALLTPTKRGLKVILDFVPRALRSSCCTPNPDEKGTERYRCMAM